MGSIAYLNREQVLQPSVVSAVCGLTYAETALGVIDVEMQASAHLGPLLPGEHRFGTSDQGSSWRDLRDSYIILPAISIGLELVSGVYV